MKARKVTDLLVGLPYVGPADGADPQVLSLTADSRTVEPGALFVAVKGMQSDGHAYLRQAVAAGARAVVVNRGREVAGLGVPQFGVEDSARLLGPLAATFYGHPAAGLHVIAITGTNGKTTCSYLLEEMVRCDGGRPGVLGTVNFRYPGVCRTASHTTPDPVQLQQLLAEMVEAGVTHVIMEVSSHALQQGRVAGVDFDGALFTNLSRDHLDYHGTMEDYFAAKKELFECYLKPGGLAVIVCDGRRGWGDQLAKGLCEQGHARVMTCGPGQMISSSREKITLSGISMTVDLAGRQALFSSPLVGAFNTRNILAVLGLGLGLGFSVPAMQQAIARSGGAPGRMESVALTGGVHPKVLVDYAHSPDALRNVLQTIKSLTRGRLIVVFGCGGDRDRGKRPIMGGIAVRYADLAIITSDNPRSEEPGRIIADIEAGMQERGARRVDGDEVGTRAGQYLVIESRHQAIAAAIRLAHRDDVVLISGKGHEDYQLTRSGRVHFDDRLEAKRELEKVWGKAVGAA
ncbi:MAG: UDP-N-acetylmuramoyl-L-alanyl-D-glutamate--2,6-diaminopimelate ligase [Desulfobulbaceae bacterium]|nr:MAG: UDP-N-acetylmuramoyl-L-alanyl-D-glutamate--2,6-diaminopimelate ligase [Desulfobulbaceae bacterium]